MSTELSVVPVPALRRPGPTLVRLVSSLDQRRPEQSRLDSKQPLMPRRSVVAVVEVEVAEPPALPSPVSCCCLLSAEVFLRPSVAQQQERNTLHLIVL